MGRPIRSDLIKVEREVRRYVHSQWREAQRLGYPTLAAFAKDIARGTVSLAPTPEDPYLEEIGSFIWKLEKDILRLVLFAAYTNDGYRVDEKAQRLRMKARRFHELRTEALTLLKGYFM
jgi:hypothetical protein